MTGFNMIKPRLPKEYQEVKYIESHGTEYIDTGVLGSEYISAEATFTLTEHNENGNNILSALGSGNKRAYMITTRGVANGYYFRMGYDQTLINGSFAPSLNVKYKVKAVFSNGSQKLYVNGQEDASDNVTGTFLSSSLMIFCVNNQGVPTYFTYAKLENLRIWSYSTLIRDYVPCFRRSDGVIGLYDLTGSVCPLTGTPLYVNAGTGSFTKGSDVQPLIPFGIAGKIGEFNQHVRNGNFVNTESWHAGNQLSLTTADNVGIIKINVVSNTSAISQNQFAITNGHKILMMAKVNSSVNTHIRISFAAGPYLAVDEPISANQWTAFKRIVTMLSNYTFMIYPNRSFEMNVNDTMQVKDVQIIDLTDIFGSGSEPTTYVQARRLIKLKLGIDIEYYQPYGLNQAVPGLKRLIGA